MIVEKQQFGSPSETGNINESLAELIQEGHFRSVGMDEIVYFNSAFSRMFNLNPNHQYQFAELFATQNQAAFVNDKLNMDGRLIQQKILFNKTTGSNFWCCISCQRNIIKGIPYIEGVVTNISDQVVKEQEYQDKAAVLEKTNLELDRFIYSASHDIRGPISTAIGLIGLLKMESDPEKFPELVQMLEGSMKKLEYLVKELSSFAKNSRQEIQRAEIKPRALLNKVLEELKGDHKCFEKIKIKVLVPTQTRVYSDPERLYMILYQVLKNSLDYCDSNKSNKLLDIQVKTTSQKISFEIFDNGIGIGSTHIESVFNMFYKGTLTSKGAGLGLYIAREAVLKLGGFININSKLGIGTTVKIEVPNHTPRSISMVHPLTTSNAARK